MKQPMTFLNALLLISALSAIIFVAYGRENTWQLVAGNADLGPFDLQNLQRNHRPNDALLCAEPLCPDGVKIDKTLPPYELPVHEVIEAIDLELRQSGVKYQRVDDRSDPSQARYVIRSNAMRFPDTNQFQAFELDGGKTGLIAYGRAQIGHSDLGVNLQRLTNLTKNLR